MCLSVVYSCRKCNRFLFNMNKKKKIRKEEKDENINNEIFSLNSSRKTIDRNTNSTAKRRRRKLSFLLILYFSQFFFFLWLLLFFDSFGSVLSFVYLQENVVRMRLNSGKLSMSMFGKNSVVVCAESFPSGHRWRPLERTQNILTKNQKKIQRKRIPTHIYIMKLNTAFSQFLHSFSIRITLLHSKFNFSNLKMCRNTNATTMAHQPLLRLMQNKN